MGMPRSSAPPPKPWRRPFAVACGPWAGAALGHRLHRPNMVDLARQGEGHSSFSLPPQS